MTKRKFRRTNSRKQANEQQQEDEGEQLPLQNPKMVEDEQLSAPPQQQQEDEGEQLPLQNPKEVEDDQLSALPQEDQNAVDNDLKAMEEDPPSQTTQHQNLEEDQDPKLVEEDQDPKLVLVEEEPPPQDHGEDGTHDLENQPWEAEAPEEIHDQENQPEEATAHPEVKKVDEEQLQPLQPQHQQEQEREEEELQQHKQPEDFEEPQPDGMDLSPTLPLPPAHEITFPEIIPANPPHNAPNFSRKHPKRKKPLNQRQRALLEKKLQAVKEKLQPIPFIPSKTLDFSKHERLLKRLGLWDFAHLEFDREIRTDFLTQLIANFNPQLRCSYVNDIRFMVNRTDLGRALKLPLKKDKINQSEAVDSDLEKLPDDSIAFMEDFVSTWFFLHEDTWILPNEIVAWIKLIRDGHPEKVDWPGLIWFMVEKELTQSSQLSSCYYASHLQCLMKAQHAHMFNEEPTTEVYMKEEEDAVDIKETNLEDFQGQEMELQQIELSLGHVKTDCEQDKDEDDVMNFQNCKDDESSLWRLDGRNHVGEHFLQRCNLNEGGVFESRREKEVEEEEVEENEEEMYDLSSKPTTLERLSSSELIQAMGTANLSYNTPAHLFSHSSGELLTSRVDNHINSVGPSVFGNGCKRELDNDDYVNPHSFNDHKRMRSDGPWDHKASDFYLCMEQLQSWTGKARIIYEAKDQEMMNVHLQQQALISELQQRNEIIEAMQRSKAEEEQKRRLEIYRLEHELYVMNNLLSGYKKALKETRRAFSEYREGYPQCDEPLYKDVTGPGGVVFSSMELEKQRKEQEEEVRVKCFMIEEQIKDFEQRWLGNLELHEKTVHLLGNRLLDLENGTKLLKESFVNHDVSET